MNKIYRIIWSKSRKKLVAVSENAKGQGKGGSKSAAVGSLLASTLVCLGSLASAEAQATCTEISSTSAGYYGPYSSD